MTNRIKVIAKLSTRWKESADAHACVDCESSAEMSETSVAVGIEASSEVPLEDPSLTELSSSEVSPRRPSRRRARVSLRKVA